MRITAGVTHDGGQAPPSMSRAAWPIDRALLRPIARAVSMVGVSLDEVLESHRTHRDCSGEREDAAEIGLADYFFLLEKLTRLTGDEAFHLSKRPLLPGALHFVLSQVSATGDLEEALRCIAKSYNFLYGGTYNHVIRRNDTLIYTIDNSHFPYRFELRPTQSDSLMECILILMHFVFILVTSENLDRCLLKVWTKRKSPNTSCLADHLGIWTAPIRWRSTTYALVYDISAASLPVSLGRGTLPEPYAIYGLIGDMIRDREQRGIEPASWVSQVRTVLARGRRGARDVAAALGISERTLRRRLEMEGVIFRELYREALNDRARLLLTNDHLVEEVAEELGYSDGRSFRRAFLGWNGITPNAYRVAIGRRRNNKTAKHRPARKVNSLK